MKTDQTTIGAVLDRTTRELEGGSVVSARIEAERIVEAATGRSRSALYLERDRELTSTETAFVECALRERLAGKPLQYVLGSQQFRYLDLTCREGVLIPRPETELVVDAALAELAKSATMERVEAANSRPVVVDIGCGSGAIALSIAREHRPADVCAIDNSDEALALTAENAQKLGLQERVRVVKSDMLSALDELKRGVDLIVSNPPYIPSGDMAGLQREVRFEPQSALDGGEDGLDFYRAIIEQAGAFLKPGGAVVFEIGFDQGAAVRSLLENAGFTKIAVLQDYQGHDRIVTAARE